MRLGVDIDSVLIENWDIWKPYMESQAEAHNHADRNLLIEIPTWDYLPGVCKKCWDFVLHDYDMTANYPIKYDALHTIADLVFRGGATINLITTRPKDSRAATEAWVSKSGLLPCIENWYISTDKASLAAALSLDYMIDDSPRNIEAFKGQHCRAIVYDRLYNRDPALSWALRVREWSEVPDLLYRNYSEWQTVQRDLALPLVM